MTRDWVFVEDTCEAVYRAAMAPNADGHVINVGTGVDTSVMEIARMVLGATGRPLSMLRHVTPRPGQVDRHISSTAKAGALLGWEATMALERGIERTVSWYFDNQAWWERLVGTETVDVTDLRRQLAGSY